MTRIVKEYDERYTEFLDVAQELFYSNGYEQTSVQEIIKVVNVAKGTFYHYFESKAALLNALVERLIQQTLMILKPVVMDKEMDAIQKFEQFFARTNNWKAANREFLLEITRVLYLDENVLLRTKLREEGRALVVPLLADIIQQGLNEEIFNVTHPKHAADIVMGMGQACSDAIAQQLLNERPNEAMLIEISAMFVAYEQSIERVLAAPSGSLRLIAPDVLKMWFPETV